ncbi:MAG: LPS-assembly protein LptD [Paludibacteraceae bacterium]|nr:LPS-assembly protein LptD [Paludibacteraceae bacterium]
MRKYRIINIVALLSLVIGTVWGQQALPSLSKESLAMAADSLGIRKDSTSLVQDSTAQAQDSVAVKKKKKNSIDHPVSYTAKDSIVLMGNGMAIMYGDGKVNYQNMELTSAHIRMNLDSNLIYASGVMDTIEGEVVGKPIFKDGQDEYESNELTYNIKTQKGFIREVVTEQGEGYVVAEKTKKQHSDVMMMSGGRYTTCDLHDHPHFYLKMTKAKVKPGDYIATGPAYMVVGDVPVPLAIPFGYFPFTKSYSSGLIMPSFGDDYQRGLYLNGIGYYFAFSDYMDLEITGDIYTKGTWAVYAQSHYVKRYRFRGNINFSYRTDVTGERGMPDYTKATNMRILWTHQQDSKANPYATFSASVNFSTSGYNRSNINSYYNSQLYSENTKSSSISYSQRFPNSPWNLSMSALISQSTRDSTISMTLPDLSVNMTSVYPFKRKHGVGKERWYEKIKLSYSGNTKIAIGKIREDKFFKSDFLRDWQTGFKHVIPISANWMLFKYLSVTPNITMTDRMYFTRERKSWDESVQAVRTDTTTGFYNVFDFNVSLTLSTKIYGYYIPSRKLFKNGKVDRFRHVMTPSLSFTYRPDFGDKFWGYYDSYDEPVYQKDDNGMWVLDANGYKVQQLDSLGQPVYTTRQYSRYEHNMYGSTGRGLQARLDFGLQNNLEVKVRNDKDTTGKEAYKVYSVIDNFSVNGGYNFAADSMNWSNFSVNLRLKIPKVNYTINLSTQLDPYMYEFDENGNPVRTNKQYWHHGRFPHWTGTTASFSYTFSSQKFKEWFRKDKKHNDGDHDDEGNMDPVTAQDNGMMTNGKRDNGHDHEKKAEVQDGYVKTDVPWSLTINYTIRYGDLPHTRANFNESKMQYKMGFVTHNLSFAGTIGLGKGWKASGTISYDIYAKKWAMPTINVSRDLHCWNMSASFVPFGPNRSYNFHIGVNASMLADLKYDKSSNSSTNKKVDWW